MSREPRVPALPIFAEAQEAEILDAMREWPKQMEDRLRAYGLEDFSEAGTLLWQAKFEHQLANPEEDSIATVIWLAEAGHESAKRALRNHATRLLEDGKADLPSSVRAYLVRLINDLVPPHPQDRSEVIKNMLRDVGICNMVDVAARRWKLPKLYSSARQHSAAYFVAVVMTEYGITLSERQVRRIYKDRTKLAARLRRFLIGDHPTI